MENFKRYFCFSPIEIYSVGSEHMSNEKIEKYKKGNITCARKLVGNFLIN